MSLGAEVAEVNNKLLSGRAQRNRWVSIVKLTIGESHSSDSLARSIQGYERRVSWIVVPWIQQEQCDFRPVRGTVDQLYTSSRVLEGAWEFASLHLFWVVSGRHSTLSFGVPVGDSPGVWVVGPPDTSWPIFVWPVAESNLHFQLISYWFITFKERISRCSHFVSVWWPQDWVSSLCRWCGPVGFVSPWLTCCWVWSGQDENQHLQIWGHDSQLEKS